MSVPVFYDPRQSTTQNQSFSPSARKPALVVADWLASGLPVVLHGFQPLTPDEISLAHDPGFVQGVLDCTIPNGFGNYLPEVASALPWTTGSMYAAAASVVEQGGFAASPSSGFHHAGWKRGMGFCTFNGLAITTVLLRERGLAKRIGILDLDRHYGNGTAEILDRLDITAETPHYSFGGDPETEGRTGSAGESWLSWLPGIMEAFDGCEVLLYQAGADPHVDDPLGGLLTTDQLRQRDRIVFQTCAAKGLPVAWNLAGGYQKPLEKVLDLHRNTMMECAEALKSWCPLPDSRVIPS